MNRPWPEEGVIIGGPSVVYDPNGGLIVETTDSLAIATIDATVVADARRAYPGYLPIHARLYADAWDEIARRDG